MHQIVQSAGEVSGNIREFKQGRCMSTATRMLSENVTSRFYNHFSVIVSRYVRKMRSNYRGIELV